ncbi:hypothetical protein CDAR_24461 [Caerostris darwini]|uniref:Uncharacterized protein n=1 Tax=Caerostris darwini TaxID=1538125 RepID=A0AAV4QL41_9ARAC|nr:hypothetical protein CDAR_24461 [Caerostris darwini]
MLLKVHVSLRSGSVSRRDSNTSDLESKSNYVRHQIMVRIRFAKKVVIPHICNLDMNTGEYWFFIVHAVCLTPLAMSLESKLSLINTQTVILVHYIALATLFTIFESMRVLFLGSYTRFGLQEEANRSY